MGPDLGSKTTSESPRTMKDPHPEVRRAPYALPKGAPALQEDPLRTRRWLLASGVIGVCAGIGIGFWCGSRGADGVEPAGSGRDLATWARRIAGAPIQELMLNAPAYLYAVDSLPAEELLWRGVVRLTEELESGRTPRVDEELLRSRVLTTLRFRSRELPANLASIRARWEQKK